MSISINRITNANVYLDKENFLGRAEEVTMPQVKMKMAEHNALGLVGSAEFPSGIEKLECKIKWASLYPEVMKKAANPFKTVDLMLKASLESYSNDGKLSEVPVTMHVKGSFKDFPMGSFKQNDNAEFDTTLTVYSTKLIVDGKDIFEIDVLSNIYNVEGADVLGAYKGNLGI